MKKIINNKKYDTDTAAEIGRWSDGVPNDLDYICEALYKKRTGEYFVHGDGGARSRYAKEGADGWFSGGEAIVPMSIDAAQKWAERHLSAAAYEAEFGDVSEYDDSTAVVSCRVSLAAKKALERAAVEQGLTQAQALDKLLTSM